MPRSTTSFRATITALWGALTFAALGPAAAAAPCDEAGIQLVTTMRAKVQSKCKKSDGKTLYVDDIIKVKSRGQFRISGDTATDHVDLVCNKVGKKSLSMKVKAASDGFLRAKKDYITCQGLDGDVFTCNKKERQVLKCSVARTPLQPPEPTPAPATAQSTPTPAAEADTAAEATAPKVAEATTDDTHLKTRKMRSSIWRAGSKEERVLLLRLDAVGASDEAAQASKALVETAMGDIPGLVVLDKEAAKAALETQLAKGCGPNDPCLADFAESFNADLVVTGTLGLVGGQQVLTLNLLRAGEGEVVNRASAPVTFGDKNFDGQVNTIVGDLFGVTVGEGPTYSLPEGKEVSFAVFPLKVAGVSEEVAKNLTQLLSVELKSIDGTSVVSKDDIKAMLDFEATKSKLGCSDDSCLAEIGGALGVDKIVVGQVGKVENRYVISLRLMDASKVTVDSRITETYVGEESQLLSAIKFAARAVVGVKSVDAGALAVTTSQEGAEVYVDGERGMGSDGKTTTPLILHLEPGKHSLRVHKDGYFDVVTEVYVESGIGRPSLAWVELEKQPGEWYESWELWAVSGGATIGVVTVGFATAFGLVTYANRCPSLGCHLIKTQ